VRISNQRISEAICKQSTKFNESRQTPYYHWLKFW